MRQMDPADLPALLTPVVSGEADYAKGNRLAYPDARRRMPFLRWLGNHVLGRLTSWATGTRIQDSQCGYTALRARAAARLDLATAWPGYGYPNDLLGRVFRAGLRMEEVVVRPVYGSERSGIAWRHALFIIPFVLLRVALARVRRAATTVWSSIVPPARTPR